MHLNDEASDEDRQQLLPFVTRLACTATPDGGAGAGGLHCRAPELATSFRDGMPYLRAPWLLDDRQTC